MGQLAAPHRSKYFVVRCISFFVSRRHSHAHRCEHPNFCAKRHGVDAL
jgi:hypothetical protein